MSVLHYPRVVGPRVLERATFEADQLFTGNDKLLDDLDRTAFELKLFITDSGAPFVNLIYSYDAIPRITTLLPGTMKAVEIMQRHGLTKTDQPAAAQSFTVNRTEPGSWIPPHEDQGEYTRARAISVASIGIFRTHGSVDSPEDIVEEFEVWPGDMVDIQKKVPHSVANIGTIPRVSVATQF